MKQVAKTESTLVKANGVTYAIKPKPKENFLVKNISEEERKRQLQIDPTFLAWDLDIYSDKLYARNMCRVYVNVAAAAVDSIFKIKKFRIADLEKAVSKLRKQFPDQYDLLCKNFSINPIKQKCTNPVIDLDVEENSPLRCLAKWGFADMFIPNVIETIPLILAKTTCNTDLSETEQVKLAHIFFTFIVGFNNMPYDEDLIKESILLTENENGSALNAKDKKDVKVSAIQSLITSEKDGLLDCVTIEYDYISFFSKLADKSVNLDLVKMFIDRIAGEEYRLKMLDFVGMLTKEEKETFESNKVKPILSTRDIRETKEKIFFRGPWGSGLNCFFNNIDDKSRKAIKNAVNKFSKESWIFGKNVEGYKKATKVKLNVLDREVSIPGYLYSKDPVLRISDPNELRMMQFFSTLSFLVQ